MLTRSHSAEIIHLSPLFHKSAFTGGDFLSFESFFSERTKSARPFDRLDFGEKLMHKLSCSTMYEMWLFMNCVVSLLYSKVIGSDKAIVDSAQT